MKTKTGWFALILLTLLLVACGSELASQESRAGTADMAAPEAVVGAEAEYDTVAYDTYNQVEVQERLIIRTGQLDIVVDDTVETMATVVALTNEMEGWVVSREVYQFNGGKSGSMTLRVPAERFDELLDGIEALALEVESYSEDSQDVTEEYVDLNARLENLEVTAERVRGFLDEADNVEEALAVNQELSRLESEIESLKGRMQYLEQSATFSTLTISLTPDELSQPLEIGGWRPSGVARDAIEALVRGLEVLATLAIWFVIVFLPLLLIVLIPLAAIIFFIRRWRRRRSTIAEA